MSKFPDFSDINDTSVAYPSLYFPTTEKDDAVKNKVPQKVRFENMDSDLPQYVDPKEVSINTSATNLFRDTVAKEAEKKEKDKKVGNPYMGTPVFMKPQMKQTTAATPPPGSPKCHSCGVDPRWVAIIQAQIAARRAQLEGSHQRTHENTMDTSSQLEDYWKKKAAQAALLQGTNKRTREDTKQPPGKHQSEMIRYQQAVKLNHFEIEKMQKAALLERARKRAREDTEEASSQSSKKMKSQATDSPSGTVKGDTYDVALHIHPLESKDGVIVQVKPPLCSAADHVPCDIVLVIDVSSSMMAAAPPQSNTIEDYGFTVMNIVLHAAQTILHTLNEKDRIGIVTFANHAKVLQGLIEVTAEWKSAISQMIKMIKPSGGTNLWAGIREGLGLFKTTNEPSGRVPVLMVLTDGQPNQGEPPEGYVPRLRALYTKHPYMDTLPATINTFGFGNKIQSGLLKSIAEAGRGNYAFIPDACRVGDSFIHAVSHVQTTYATRCTLKISAPKGVLLKSKMGKSVDEPVEKEAGRSTLTFELGNLQYGQSRDIYIKSVDTFGKKKTFQFEGLSKILNATLEYTPISATEITISADQDLRDDSSALSLSEVAYHQSRSMICKLLSNFFYLTKELNYCTITEFYTHHHGHELAIEGLRARVVRVIGKIPASKHKDKFNFSLMHDLKVEILQALKNRVSFATWGQHYLLSLWNAHSKQLCIPYTGPDMLQDNQNEFSSAGSGPLQYNQNEYFIRCRDILQKAFVEIEPPEPSLANETSAKVIPYTGPDSLSTMSQYMYPMTPPSSSRPG